MGVFASRERERELILHEPIHFELPEGEEYHNYEPAPPEGSWFGASSRAAAAEARRERDEQFRIKQEHLRTGLQCLDSLFSQVATGIDETPGNP